MFMPPSTRRAAADTRSLGRTVKPRQEGHPMSEERMQRIVVGLGPSGRRDGNPMPDTTIPHNRYGPAHRPSGATA